MSQSGPTSERRYQNTAALLAVVGAAAALSAWPAAAHAQAAVPAYKSFEVPAPEPQAGAAFGERLRALGDVDDDGIRDVLISSSNHDGDDGNGGVLTNSGRLYVFSGRTRALLRTLEPPLPQVNARFGFWDANLGGDVDGDGAADFVTSAPGQVVGERRWDRCTSTAGGLRRACARSTRPRRRGFRITCVEMGPALAAVWRRNLADFSHMQMIESAFEAWRPPCCEQFDLVFAATAWHWLDPATRYVRAWKLLRPGGHLAFWSATHVLPENGDPFFLEIQDVYDEIGEGLPADATRWRPGELPDDQEEVERDGLFEVALVRQFDWQISYDADEYVRLLDTFSGHIAMRAWQRDRLYGEVRRRLSQRSDGRVLRHWGAVLHVARRVDTPALA